MPTMEDRFTAIVLAIFRANGTMLEWGDHFAAQFDLTSARWQMLGALAMSQEPLSSPRIAESMGVTRQGAQKQLNLLLESGWIEQLPNPTNIRSPLYRLSKLGQSRYVQVEAQWMKHVRALSKQLDAQELDIAGKVLKQIAALHTQISAGEAS